MRRGTVSRDEAADADDPRSLVPGSDARRLLDFLVDRIAAELARHAGMPAEN